MKRKFSLFFLNYLRIIAVLQIQKIKLLQKLKHKKLTIIGITGSAGKTSTLMTAEAVLKPNFVIKTNSGANSESGIPLNILDLKTTDFSLKDWFKLSILAPLKLLINWKTYEIYLVEMGIDEPTEPKNMSFLLKIIKPDIGIFLNVNPVHSFQFDKTVSENIVGQKRLSQILENIGKEKAKLINSLPPLGVAIINHDDPIVAKTASTRAKLLSFSKTSGSTLKIIKTTSGENGFEAVFSYQNQHFNVQLPHYALPETYVTSIAATLLIAIALNLDIKKAIDDLESNLELPPGRSSLLNGIKNTKIIDSSYNSSPFACAEMIKLLSYFSGSKIAVLGDMRELGNQSEKAHRDICKLAIKSADLIISVGLETQKYFDKNPKIHSFQFWWEAAKFLKEQIKGGETILIKGSQNTIFLEEITKSILDNDKDVQKLCRQSHYWLRTKKEFRNKNS